MVLRLRGGGGGDGLTLNVSAMSGKKIAVETTQEETISKLKEKIEAKEGIPAKNIRFVGRLFNQM